ncbi:MAG: DUF1501 domain-containing protein [Deinococcaceae bacterium]
MTSRRDFLKLSTLAITLTSGMPQFLARAAAQALGDKTLVVIQLTGGNDGLNTLVPFTNGAYYANRPNIAISKQDVLPISQNLGMHPNLKPLMSLWDSGKLAFMESVGYPNPDRSHFKSMAIWHSADVSGASKEGWIGRIAETIGDPFCATYLGSVAPAALRTEDLVLPAISSLERFQLKLPKGTDSAFEAMMSLPRQGEAAFLATATKHMMVNTQNVQKNLKKYKAGSRYPEHAFAEKLKSIAQLIAAGVGQKILYTELGSFDTHAGQRADQDRLLGELATGLEAFTLDLEVQGLSDRVMVLAFSEFGRRVAENDSGGTDHGQGGVMFALGGGIKGGIYGDSPDLERLDQGDLIYKQDFRGVYGRILDRWLNIPAAGILGGRFEGPAFTV